MHKGESEVAYDILMTDFRWSLKPGMYNNVIEGDILQLKRE